MPDRFYEIRRCRERAGGDGFGDQIFQARLQHRRPAAANRRNLVGVDVHPDDPVPQRGQAAATDGTDVAEANDTDIHTRFSDTSGLMVIRARKLLPWP